MRRDSSPAPSSVVSDETVTEVAMLSCTWIVFQQLMLAWPPQQPVILTATTHTELLPPDLLRFFGQRQARPCCCPLRFKV